MLAKKVVLVSALNYNYGSVLQSYAFQHILGEKGANVEIINYQKKLSVKQLIRVFNLALVRAKLLNIQKKVYFLSNLDRNKWNKRKEMNYRKFIERYIDTTFVIKGYKSLKKFAVDCDAIIVGSDQLWNPINNGTHFATVEFAPKNVARYSYATSFGVSKLKKNDLGLMKKVLPSFNMISVREQQGAEIIKSILGPLVDVHIDLDPTLLLEDWEWDRLLRLDVKKDNRKYILGYFISANAKYRKLIDDIAKSNKLDLVVLPHIDRYVGADVKFEKCAVCSAGPIEFLNYIRNAEYVVTDSFHGTVFSILYKKQFCVLDRFKSADSLSMNSRIDHLLSTVDLRERHIVLDEDVWGVLNRGINFDRVHHILRELRKKSLEYIDSVLMDIGEK